MQSTQIRLVAINRGDLLLASSMDFMSYFRRSQLHNPDFSSTILEFVGGFILDSAKSQNLVNLIPCEAPENSPASWCKKSGEASSSASADFLLEAEKRGSPPKSEKAELFGVQGERGGGCSPFCEKESELSGENGDRFAESTLDSANSQNLIKTITHAVRTLTKFLLLFPFAKRRVPLHLVIARKSVGFSWQSIKQ